MGSLLSGTTKTKTDSKPWAPQGAALENIFSQAGTNFNAQSGTPFYQGDLYAGMDPQTAQAIQSILGHTNGAGAQNAAALNQAGQSLINPAAYSGAIGNFATAAGADPTQSNITAATAYANNPAIDGMIDAASRDVNRNLYEGAIPDINRAGTASGNVNSSRAGVAEGIARRGAADQIGDISAGIRGDAFNRGLALAEGARGTNLSALGQTAGLYGQQLGMGVDTINAGNNLAIANQGAAIDASSLYQQDRQGQLDQGYQQWIGNDTRQSDLLNRYYGIIGANNWGGTQTTTQKSSPSLLSAALGIGSLAAGFGAFGGGGK